MEAGGGIVRPASRQTVSAERHRISIEFHRPEVEIAYRPWVDIVHNKTIREVSTLTGEFPVLIY